MKLKSRNKENSQYLFCREIDVIEKCKISLENKNISKDFLIKQHQVLINEYNKLLKTAINTTSLSDQYQKKFILATEKQKELLKELQEANRTKDKFFSIIAHDLKNIFIIVLEGSDLLWKSSKLSDEDIKWLAEMVHKNTLSLYNLLENLLNWSRLQTGSIQCRPKSIRLVDKVHNCVDLLNESAISKKIRLTHTIDESIQVYADPDMLTFILRNFVNNAIKFTKSNGEIKISSFEANGFIRISVSDTGIGISKENIKKIFRSDVHYTTTGTSDEKGSGLGLILCKEFIEKNGGDLKVESQLNKGSTFTFSLKRHK